MLPKLDREDVAKPRGAVQDRLVLVPAVAVHIVVEVLAEPCDGVEHDGALLLLRLCVVIAILHQFRLRVPKHHLDPVTDVRHASPNVILENRVELLGKVHGALPLREVRVGGVCGEEVFFCHQGALHRLGRVNILLASIHHRHIPVVQRVHLALKDLSRIGTLIHQIKLCQHTDGPLPLRVHLPRDLKPVGVCKVAVGGGDSEDDAVGARDDVKYHRSDHVRNVVRLVADRDLCEARQVDQSEVYHVLAVHSQNDGLRRHPFGVARHTVRLRLNCLLDVVEGVNPASDVGELCVVLVYVLVEQLQHEGTPGADACAAR
mmetsp:Transcript_28569/g.55740  ORF Transcript_28569/g.55740 Transcript_28569/m.55740 type:complete len:318 (-) Transcript_28569:142-1095(-)